MHINYPESREIVHEEMLCIRIEKQRYYFMTYVREHDPNSQVQVSIFSRNVRIFCSTQ